MLGLNPRTIELVPYTLNAEDTPDLNIRNTRQNDRKEIKVFAVQLPEILSFSRA